MREILHTLILLLLASAVHAETITISEVVPFGENSGASENVKAKCKLETRIPEYIVKAAKDDISIVMTDKSLDLAEGSVASLKIVQVHAYGGGNWSGGKRVSVSVELKKDGRIVDSTRIQRSSRVGFGNCAILKKISRVLGEDIVTWLHYTMRNPPHPPKASISIDQERRPVGWLLMAVSHQSSDKLVNDCC